MGLLTRVLLATSAVSAALAGVAPALGAGSNSFAFVETKLDSNLPNVAEFTVPALQNAWGIAFSPGGDFWIAGNNSGVSLLLSGLGVQSTGLPQVTIPLPAPPLRADTGPLSAPTGVVWNPSSKFDLPGTKDAAIFIFDTEDGTIDAWNPAVNLNSAVVAVDNSKVGSGGAVYKGLTLGITATGVHLYAANLRAGTVDVFDGAFTPNLVDGAVPDSATATNIAGTFADPAIPAGFAPFNVQNVNGDLFVTYAKQDQAKHDEVTGAHLGFVDVFTTDGVLLRRFASGGPLNAPWGVTQAPASFGAFGNDILVGNFGDGRINVFSPQGVFLGPLLDANLRPIVNPETWALTFGGGVQSTPDTLFFTAGGDNQTNGVFGTIVPAAATTE